MKKMKMLIIFIIILVVAAGVGFLVQRQFFTREKLEESKDEGIIFLSCHFNEEVEEGVQAQIIQSLQFNDGTLINVNYDETTMITEELDSLHEMLRDLHEECLENNDNRVPGMINNCRLDHLRHTWIQSFDMNVVRRFLDRNDQVEIDEIYLSDKSINEIKEIIEDRGFTCTRSDEATRIDRHEFEG